MSNKKKVAPPSKPKPKEPIIPESKTGKKARKQNKETAEKMMGGGKIGKPIKYAVGGPTKPAWMRNR